MEAFTRFGVPVIVNTDQGSQFTAEEFTAGRARPRYVVSRAQT